MAEFMGADDAMRGANKSGAQYTTKDRTQCIDNDRFLVTKKVNVQALPEHMKKPLEISDHIETRIEVSAKDVHEQYLVRI